MPSENKCQFVCLFAYYFFLTLFKLTRLTKFDRPGERSPEKDCWW